MQAAQAVLVEKLVTGKLQKNVYLDQETGILKKKEEVIERINALVRAF